MSSKVEQLRQQLKARILVLDGGMGTMIQSYRLSCTSYHRVVTDTQESHHFHVSRN